MPPLDSFGLLAQEADAGDVIIACLMLIALVIVLAVVVMWLRRWIKSGEEIPAGGFTLGDLRALLKAGKISNEEFDRTRAMILAASTKASEKKEPEPKVRK